MEKAGAVRDGGSFNERMGHVACWNSVMDEDRYHGPEMERIHRRLTQWRADGSRGERRDEHRNRHRRG